MGVACSSSEQINDMLKEDASIFKLIPREKITREICMTLLNHDCKYINWIPIDLQTNEMYLKVINNNLENIKLINKEKLTVDLFNYFFKQIYTENSNLSNIKIVFEYIPKKIMTQELCNNILIFIHNNNINTYITNNNFAQFNVRCIDRFIYHSSDWFYITEFKRDVKFNYLDYIPASFQTYEMYNFFLNRHSYFYNIQTDTIGNDENIKISELCRIIPEEYKTQKFYDILFNNIHNFVNFKYIPIKFQTKNMYDIMINKDISNIKYILVEYYINKSYDEYLEMINYNFENIKYIPKERLNDFYKWFFKFKYALDSNFSNIECIFKDISTHELWILAIHFMKQNNITNMFKYIPNKIITEKFCSELILTNIYLFKYIPKELLTEDFFNNIFKYNILDNNNIDFKNNSINYKFKVENVESIFQFVPKEILTQELCNNALDFFLNILKVGNSYYELYRYDIDFGIILNYIPIKFQTNNFYVKMICHNMKNIKRVPKEKLTLQLFNELFNSKCINKKINIYTYIPSNIFTQEFCNNYLKFLIKISYEYNILECIPIQFQTNELYKIMLKNNEYIKYLPIEKLTQELCDIATEKYCSLEILNYIPEKFRTQKMYELLFLYDNINISHIPKHMLTQEFFNNATNINCSFEMLKQIPLECRTQKMYTFILKEDIKNIIYIPLTMLTQEMCNYVFDRIKYNNYEDLKLIPEKFRTEEMNNFIEYHKNELKKKYVSLFEEDINQFEYIPIGDLTQDICDIAFEMMKHNNYKDFSLIPNKFITPEMLKIVVKIVKKDIDHINKK